MYKNIYRIIDANINRASEALRVLEDWARFSKNDLSATKKLKEIRHTINNLLPNPTNIIQNRESITDVGQYIENTSYKKGVKEILHANSKRAEEALRVLAEYGQVINVDIKKLENARYEIYTLEKELLKSEKLIRLQKACLYLVASRSNLKSENEFLNAIEKAIEGGIDIIQLREKGESENNILHLAKEIKKLITNSDILFIINDRVDLALASDADGVHLGQDDLTVRGARKITPEGFIIGLSTHSIEQGLNGFKSGADYLGVGPVFQTPTKSDYKPVGLEYVKWASQNLKEILWFAIGGIDDTNINEVISAGAQKVAVVRAIMNTNDPFKITKQLKEKLTQNKLTYAESR